MKPTRPSPRSFRPLRPASARLVLAAGVALAAVAGAPAPAVVAQPAEANLPDPPFAGVISVDRVEVRSGAGESYYPVAVLEEGDRVTVVEDFYNWHRIEAPEGLHAFVSRRDLDRRGDGSVGVSNAEAARVTIKGIDRGWDESFRTIKTLAYGERVQIVAAAGDAAYEILAPAGSLVFLPPGTVKPLAQLASTPAPAPMPAPAPVVAEDPTGEMVPLGDAGAEAPAPAPEAADVAALREGLEADAAARATLAAANAEAAAPVTLPPLVLGDGEAASGDPVTPGPSGAAGPAAGSAATPSEAVAAVEEAQLERFTLPLEQQPLAEMEEAYASLLGSGGLRPFEIRLVESRLRAIERNRQLMAAVEQIQQRKEGLAVVEPTVVEPEPDEPYAALGILRTSSVFAGEEGGVALPKMYRVVDPASERTIAYLRLARGLDATPLLGRVVGVRGNREIDPTLGTPLVVVQRIDALDATAD
ncbi:SH3 domain-containing protein [Phycisphaera mikurensis]|uniref:SH3b domain-containing protein n=1 Tax=Phycisphaera mikurensis (strain NBRC 102666 / KCTC 22515 / FYK2301M01) TaxID=1142394 RepID=I0IIC6_PHYMF|nr:SH3 domain-containing protein [Phycisphaera mikurensis]MBB6442422.1 hypothetical protein [Phycisphaera mikurensis]BAM05014.1 hypothetical protein PSMK_28550 [Phycisphaera mikurensis NBRC 102666]